jgi:hypothetical protein
MLQFQDTSGLFENFEVNATPFWPKVSRLIGGSIVLHLILVACVVFIPPVRDALSIAAMFSDAGFVDRAYNKTEIEAGDITEITTEKFHYPEGYFAMDQMGFPSPSPTPLVVVQQFNPAPVPPTQFDPVQLPTPTPSPSAIAAASPSPTASPGSAQSAEDQKAAEKAQKELEKASKETGIELPEDGEINKRPLKDWVSYASELSKQNKLDLNQPFEVVIDAELDQDGKLKNPKFTKKAGDLNLADLGGRLVAALNDSGVLIYLKEIREDNPNTHVTFTIKQDTEQTTANVESEAASVDSARQLAAGFKVMIAYGAGARKGKNEEVFLRNTTVSANEKKLTFGLVLPRQVMIDLLKKEIASASASPTPAP